MTKEQIIKHLKLMQSGVRNAIRFTKNDKKISEEERKEDIEIYQDQLESFNVAIKALEQEEYYKDLAQSYEKTINKLTKAIAEQQPSDDCVSRASVFETIDDCNSDGLKGIFCSYDDGERFKEYIKMLPPATPTRKVGKWIEVWESQRDDYTGEYDEWREHKCSACGFQEFDAYRFNYCPNCGAEMKGSENDR